MNPDDGLQERYLQVKHDHDRYKFRQQELESAYEDAENRRLQQEDRIAALERQLREQSRLAEQRAEIIQVTEAELSEELQKANAKLHQVKQTLTQKDQELVVTKRELQSQQDVFDQLEEEKEHLAAVAAAATSPLDEDEDFDVDTVVDDEGDLALDPVLLLQQQEEIARLRDMLDEEAELRRQAEAAAVTNGYDSESGSELDAETGISLAAQMGAGVSLADELAGGSARANADRSELDRLEAEKAEMAATLEAERAKFVQEQEDLRRERERLQMDAEQKAAAEAAALAAKEEMELRMSRETTRIQAELSAERERFVAEQKRMQEQAAALEAEKLDWAERERLLKAEHEAELTLQQKLLSELPPDDSDEDDEDLPPMPASPEPALPGLPSDAEGGTDERLAYEMMAAEHAAELKAKRQLEEDTRLARQLSEEATPAKAKARVHRAAAPHANLHQKFPNFEPSAIDAMVAANGGDVAATETQLRQMAATLGITPAAPTPSAVTEDRPRRNTNPFLDPHFMAEAEARKRKAQEAARQKELARQKAAYDQRRRDLLAAKQARERADLEAAKDRALLEKGRRFKAEQAELYRQAQERAASRRALETKEVRRRAEMGRPLSQHAASRPTRQPADREFKVVLPSQEKLYEAIMQNDDHGAAKRLGLGKSFDGRLSIKCTPAAVHLIPNIKRQHKSESYVKAWEWRLNEISEVHLNDRMLELSIWKPGSGSAAETYKFKIKDKKAAPEVHATLVQFIREATERRDASMARDMQCEELRRSGQLRDLDREFLRELRLNDEFIRIMSKETGIDEFDLRDEQRFVNHFASMGPKSHKKLRALRKQPTAWASRAVDPAAERERSRVEAERAMRRSSRRDSKAAKKGHQHSDNGRLQSPDYAEVLAAPQHATGTLTPSGSAPMLPPRPDVVDTHKIAWAEPESSPLEVKPLAPS